MSTEVLDHTTVALNALMAERTAIKDRLGKLDAALASLGALNGNGHQPEPQPILPATTNGDSWPPPNFKTLTNTQKILSFLDHAKSPQTTMQVTEALVAAGAKSHGDVDNVISVGLRHAAKSGQIRLLGKVARSGRGGPGTGSKVAVWGLPGWQKAFKALKQAGLEIPALTR